MNKTNLIKLLLPFTAMLLLFSVACDYTPVMAPEAPIAASVVSADEINWVSWNQEFVERIKLQNKSFYKKGKKGNGDGDNDDTFGFDSKWIKANKGGTVGSEKLTLGNKVRIVKDALRKNSEVSVRLIFDDDELINGFGEVDFEVNGGSYKFEKDVRITLTYKYLDLGDDFDPATLTIWWVDDTGEGWVEIEDLELNENRKTVSFWVDHFTRYGWAY